MVFEKILYPTDLSKETKKTLTYTKHLKEAGTKEVVVLNVIDQKVIDTIGLIFSAKVVQSVESEIKRLEEDRKKGLEPIIAELKELFYSYPGKNQVVLHFKDGDRTVSHAIGKKYSVNIDDKFIEEIRRILGNKKVWTEKR